MADTALSRVAHYAPLTFSQLQHWHFYELHKQKSLRHLIVALQLEGPLNRRLLRQALVEVVGRHDGLRTQIVIQDGEPVQQIVESRPSSLREVELTSVPVTHHSAEIDRNLEDMVFEPVDVAIDLLFEVRVLRFADRCHVLLVVMEHIVSDMWSMDVFIRDLFAAYEQLRREGRVTLPEPPVQLSDYAVWQKSQHSQWLEKHAAYWTQRLAGCGRLRFPADASGAETAGGWGVAPVCIDNELKLRLQAWCRDNGTTLVMGVFAAYIAAVFRWCGVRDAVMRFEGNGRTNPSLERTIGYFTAPLYLRIEIREEDRFEDLVKRVFIEYCSAHEHWDASYIESRMPRRDFTRNPAFNWIPQLAKLEIEKDSTTDDALTCSMLSVDNPRLKDLRRDTEPFAIFFEQDEEIQAAIWYPRDRFSAATMGSLARCFLTHIRSLAAHPAGRIAEVETTW